ILTNLFRNITTLYAMLTEKDYALSLKSKAMIVAALAYFILPTDLTPDFIPFVGYIDDGIVITALMKRVKSEIDRFLQWKADI
ncbi:MAG: YkvA family protein, partial [Candidatus Kapaibacterium sp.]